MLKQRPNISILLFLEKRERIVLYIHILTIPGEANKIMSQLEWKQKILIKA